MVGKFAAILIVALMLISGIPVGESAAVHSRADKEVILRVAMQDDIRTLNYLSANDAWTWKVISWVFDGLTWQNASNNDHVEPWAAEWFHHGPRDTWGEVPYPDNDNNTDYRNWTVKLRDGIKWHDWDSQTGDDRYVRAHDVIFSLRLAADVSRYSGSIDCVVARDSNGFMIYGRDIADKIPDGIYKGPNGDWAEGVDVSDQANYPDLPVVLVSAGDDDLTLHYRLMKTYVEFPTDTLNTDIVPERIWSKHIADKTSWNDPQALISFGPFKFDFWNISSETSRVNTFRDYFGTEYYPIPGQKKPYIDAMVFKVYGTTDAAVMALTGDKVDYIAWAIDPGYIDTINHEPNLTLVRNSDLGFTYVGFNMRKPEFGYAGYDPDDIPSGGVPTYNGDYTDVGKPFRVAFSHIIDKQYMVSKGLQGFGSVGTSVVSPMNSFWYNPKVKIYDYDPDAAKEILDAQGWNDTDGDGWREFPNRGDDEITMMAPPSDYDICWSCDPYLMVQQDAQKVGINFKSVPTNFGTIVEQLEKHQFDMYVMGWSISSPESSASAPCDFFSSVNDGDGNNYVGYHNESFDRLCTEFRSETDLEKRKEIGYQLQQSIAEDAPYSILYYRDVIEAYNNRFAGWVPRYGTIFNDYSIYNLRPGASRPDLSVSIPETVVSGETADVSVYVEDNSTHGPMQGITVRFYTSQGNFSPSSDVTDRNGMAVSEYTAPNMNHNTSVIIEIHAYDPAESKTYTVYRTINVIPRPEANIYIETSPPTILRGLNNTPTNLEIKIYASGNYADLNIDPESTDIKLSIAPAGADVSFDRYENGTWYYKVTGTVFHNGSRQYSISVNAVFNNGVIVSSASKQITFIALESSSTEAASPSPSGGMNDSTAQYYAAAIAVGLGAAIIAGVYVLKRKQR